MESIVYQLIPNAAVYKSKVMFERSSNLDTMTSLSQLKIKMPCQNNKAKKQPVTLFSKTQWVAQYCKYGHTWPWPDKGKDTLTAGQANIQDYKAINHATHFMRKCVEIFRGWLSLRQFQDACKCDWSSTWKWIVPIRDQSKGKNKVSEFSWT